MSVNVDGKKVLLIDRTIPEILKCNTKIEPQLLLAFANHLHLAGADLIEIDRSILDYLGYDIDPRRLIFRIKGQEDLEVLESYKFAYSLVGCKPCNGHLLQCLKHHNHVPIILEIESEELACLSDCLKGVDFDGIDTIRLQGLNKYQIPEWIELISWIRDNFKVKTDVCPGNLFHLAVAAVYELILSTNRPDFATVSFTGIGGSQGYAALEEVVMALKIIGRVEVTAETRIFSDLSHRYKNICNFSISQRKPVIGKNIFRVESGIHADGLIKNPLLYEAYEPEMVGLKRDVVIGKHSGTSAIGEKLRQLGREEKKESMSIILEKIRRRSIQLKRNLEDYELLNMCGG